MADGPNIGEKFVGHFPGEQDNVLSRMVDGLVHSGALVAPDAALLARLQSGSGASAPPSAQAAAPAATPRPTEKVQPPAPAPKPTQVVPPTAKPTQVVTQAPTPPKAATPPTPPPAAPVLRLVSGPPPSAEEVSSALSTALGDRADSGLLGAVHAADPIAESISARLPKAALGEDEEAAGEEDEDLFGDLVRGGGDDDLGDDAEAAKADPMEAVRAAASAPAKRPTGGLESRASIPQEAKPRGVEDDLDAVISGLQSQVGGDDLDVDSMVNRALSDTHDAVPSPAGGFDEVASAAIDEADALALSIKPKTAPVARTAPAITAPPADDLMAGLGLEPSSDAGVASDTGTDAGTDTDALDDMMAGLEATPPEEPSALPEPASEGALASASLSTDAAPESIVPEGTKKTRHVPAKGDASYLHVADLGDQHLIKAAEQLLVDAFREMEASERGTPDDFKRKFRGFNLSLGSGDTASRTRTSVRTRAQIEAAQAARPDDMRAPPAKGSIEELMATASAAVQKAPGAADSETDHGEVKTDRVQAVDGAATEYKTSASQSPSLGTLPTQGLTKGQAGQSGQAAAEDKLLKDLGDLADMRTLVLTREEMERAGRELVGVGPQPLYQVVLGIIGFVLVLASAGVYVWFHLFTGLM